MSNEAARETVRFYFSFNDPHSFLIFPAMKSLAQSYKVNVESHPLGGYDHSGLFSKDPAQAAYWSQDALRLAQRAGRKLNYLPAPQDSIKARRALFMAQERLLGAKYINLVFALRWVNGGDISDSAQMAKWLAFLELKPEGLLAAMETDMFEQELAAAEKRAQSDGVIGVPFFRFRNSGFWGAHQVEPLEAEIKSDPNLIIHHDAAYGVVKAEELARRLQAGDDLLVLDVRIPKDFAAGHIPGANCIPAKVVRRSLDKLDKKWTIILLDDGGVEANEAAFTLASEGYSKTSVLDGGIKAWKGPLEKGLDKWHDKLKS